jgi:prepilin-type N-terminal cleavage/methylation domain-containing protein
MKVKSRRAGQSGFSLAEALVVVAIIGLISMVSIPQFITMYRSSVFKSALRQFMTDVRTARQRGISFSRRTMVSFPTGTSARTYSIYEWLPDSFGVYGWVAVGSPHRLNEQAYVLSSTFANFDSDVGPTKDIVFEANGTIANIPGATGDVVLATDANIPINSYRIQFSAPGFMKVY